MSSNMTQVNIDEDRKALANLRNPDRAAAGVTFSASSTFYLLLVTDTISTHL